MEKNSFSAISDFLHSLDRYVILRNHDFRANIGRGGDIDLLVRDMSQARAAMRTHLGAPWWEIFHTYVEGCFYLWGHIDLTPKMEWHGAVYISNETIFDQSGVSELGFRKPRLAHEALICWFASLIWGGFFKDRYKPVLLQAAEQDAAAFEQALEHAVGKKWGARLMGLLHEGHPETSAKWVKPLRRALWWNGFKRAPLQTVAGWGRHWAREVALRWNPPAPWISISGPSAPAVADGLEARWEAMGLKIRRYQEGPRFLPFCLSAYNQQDHDGTITHALRQFLLLVDWIAGYWFSIATMRAKAHFVILETEAPRCSRYWISRILKVVLPTPDASIFLKCPEAVSGTPKNHYFDAAQPLNALVASAAEILETAARQRGTRHQEA